MNKSMVEEVRNELLVFFKVGYKVNIDVTSFYTPTIDDQSVVPIYFFSQWINTLQPFPNLLGKFSAERLIGELDDKSTITCRKCRHNVMHVLCTTVCFFVNEFLP